MNSKCCKQIFFLYARSCLMQHSQRYAVWQPARLKRETPELYYSLQERLEAFDIKLKDPERYEKVNIGLPHDLYTEKIDHLTKHQDLKKIKEDKTLEKKSRNRTLFIDVEKVEAEGLKSTRFSLVHNVAEHYNVFRDLFGEFAYFYPVIPMNITYDYDDSTVSPVYYGNLLKPRETSTAPHVHIDSDLDNLWTLVVTSPDNNLYEERAEVLHWFVGNIQGEDAKNGEEIVPYLQPFPPQGTGFHRYIFTLYKQEKMLDFTEYKQNASEISKNLRSRTFHTYDFYKKYEEDLTPAGLSFFQADWDSTLTEFFHTKLDMREPSYEYEFPKPYLAPEREYPARRAFNLYLDMHRDQKDIAKDMLLKRLSKIHPFKGDIKILPFPQAVKIDPHLSIWIKNEIRQEREGSGKFKQMYKGDNRPYQFLGERTKKPPYPFFNKNRGMPDDDDDDE